MADFTWLAKPIIDLGFPVLGAALGVPELAPVAARLVKGALGLPADASNQEVASTINANPSVAQTQLATAESDASARWEWLAKAQIADTEAQGKALADVGETMRVEAASDSVIHRWWRPIYAFELTIECAVAWTWALWDLAVGDGRVAAWAAQATMLLSTYWCARFGVLGVYVNGRTREKEVAITGQVAPTVAGAVLKAVTRR